MHSQTPISAKPTMVQMLSASKAFSAKVILTRKLWATLQDSSVYHRRRVVFVAGLCLLMFARSRSLAADPSTTIQYLRSEFTVDDGLPDNRINSIIETENGLLWIGTASGLASFDGRTFTAVNLRIPGAPTPATIHSLVIGSEGDLWVGADTGIVRIPKRDLNDPDVPHSTAFRLGQQQTEEAEVLFRDRSGTIWAGTGQALYRFNGSQFLLVARTDYVARIRQALDGRLLLDVASGFVEFDGQRLIKHPGIGARLGVPDDQIFDVYQDSNGTMWFCTGMGLRAVSEQTGVIRAFGPPRIPAYRTYLGPDGGLWASGKFGVYKVVNGQTWAPFQDLSARYLYAGQEGDLWVARSGGRGLVHLQPRTVQMFTKADGLPSDVAMDVLPAHDGRLWVGGGCGLAVFEGPHVRTFDEKSGLKNTCVWSLAEDRTHAIWIGTWGGGLFRYQNGHFSQFTKEQGLASRVVTQITVARDDSLWLATPEGVSHFRLGTIRNYGSAEGLSNLHVNSIHQDRRGTIWVATLAGVERLVSDRFLPVPEKPTTYDAMPQHFFETSDGGLYTTNLRQGFSQIEHGQISLQDSTLSLMEMVIAPGQALWFSGRHGVVRISEQEFALLGRSSSPPNYEVFNRADGLNTTEASAGSPNIAMTPDGRIWIATVGGLARIDTSHLPTNARPPKMFIAGVTIDSAKHPVGDRLVLPPGIHHIELSIAAINLANPQKIRLQYRLDGVDSDWLDGTSSRTAVYSGLPSGSHRLLVRATNSIGHWSTPEVVYELTQQPRFYARPFFQVNSAIVTVLLLVWIYILRMRYVVRQTRVMLEQRQAERETVARDLHDTFFQGIQGLLLRFNTATSALPKDEPSRRVFEETLRKADQVMLEGRQLVLDLRAATPQQTDLPAALAQYGEQMQKDYGCEFKLTVNGNTWFLHPIVYEDVLVMGKEALGNAFRHSQGQSIEAELNYEPNEFRMRIRDDGTGIDPAILSYGRREGHWGLPGMRERAEKIGAHLDIWSGAATGTEVELRLAADVAYISVSRRRVINKLRSRWPGLRKFGGALK